MANTKKNKQKTLIVMGLILLAVCVLGFGAVFLLQEDETQEEEETYSVFTFNSSNITKVAFSNDKDSDLRFYKDGEVWYLEKDTTFPVNQKLFGQVGNKLKSAVGFRKFEATEKNLKNFGINDPKQTVVITTLDGREYTYILGLYNQAMRGYYLYDKREDVIYLVDETFQLIFGNDLFAYGQVDTFPSFDITTFRDMKVSNGKTDYQFLYLPEGDPTSTIESVWYFGEPFKQKKPCVDTKINDLLTMITELSYTKLAAYNVTKEDLPKFGIDDSRMIQFHYLEASGENKGTEHVYTIYVGDLDETETYYYVYTTDHVLLGGTDGTTINLVARSQLDSLLFLSPIDYAYINVFTAKLSEMKDITFTMGEKSYTFTTTCEKVGEEDVVTVSYNGAVLESRDSFVTIYQELLNIFVKEFIAADDPSLKDSAPTLEVVIHQDNKKVDTITLRYTEYNSSYYQVEVNGLTERLVERSAVLDLLENMKAFFGSLQ